MVWYSRQVSSLITTDKVLVPPMNRNFTKNTVTQVSNYCCLRYFYYQWLDFSKTMRAMLSSSMLCCAVVCPLFKNHRTENYCHELTVTRINHSIELVQNRSSQSLLCFNKTLYDAIDFFRVNKSFSDNCYNTY